MMQEIRKERREELQIRGEDGGFEGDGSESDAQSRVNQEAAEYRKFRHRVFQLPLVFYFDFDRAGLEKPWSSGSREKKDEYFNYGKNTHSPSFYFRLSYTLIRLRRGLI
jgi:hypothetical protein